MTVPAAGLPKALHHLASGQHVTEVAILSTCNRTEVYAVCETFHGALSDINQFFVELSGLGQGHFAEHLFTAYDEAAVSHLFGVTAGLDSAVVGETEILGQVRTAFDAAQSGGVTGPHLSSLFRHALETGKRARTETGNRPRHCLRVACSCRVGGRPDGQPGRSHRAGSGHRRNRCEHGQRAAAGGRPAKCSWPIAPARRPHSLPNRSAGRAVPLHELPTALMDVDVLLTGDIVGLGRARTRRRRDGSMASREGRELLIVDTAMPRDVDPSASTLPGVTLLDLESIRDFVELGLDSRRREIDAVRAIVAEECERFTAGCLGAPRSPR